MEKTSKIYVAGHGGLVGSAIMRALGAQGYANVVVRLFDELDLRNQAAVNEFFEQERPEYVFLAAAKVGGIYANNTYKAEFIYDNLMIATNVIHASYAHGVKKLINLGSSCIYPKNAPQPLKEEYLLTGALEQTNEPYAVAKIAAIKLCQSYNEQYGTNFLSVMPTNLYGPYDNFNLETAHVLPALIRKFHEAKVANLANVMLWGSGKPLREFLYVDDLANALLFLMEKYEACDIELINIGVGSDISIDDLAMLIKQIVGFEGNIIYDPSKPDGMAKKLLNISKLSALGWQATTSLNDGLAKTYAWYCKFI